MKRILVAFVALIFTVSVVYAANFAPTVMKLSAASTIQYNFDGKDIEIPLNVSGKPGTLYFVINTKGQADKIVGVQNGYLGWHYVDKIDTCVYLSTPMNIDVGTNLIDWNGKDNQGINVPAGDYTYYMWAYDHINTKIVTSSYLHVDFRKGVQIEPYDEQGNPYVKPVLYEVTTNGSQTLKKWILGGDPNDSTLVETTKTEGVSRRNYIALQPDNQKIFYVFKAASAASPGLFALNKYEWVPNGSAVQDMDWGDNGEYQYQSTLTWAHWQSGVITDRQGMLYATNQDISSSVSSLSELIYVDMETGEEMRRVDLEKWWGDMNDAAKGGQACGGPTTIIYYNGNIFASSHTSCMKNMLDPFAEDDNEVVKWVNANGDYIGDHNNEPDSNRPWVCNDYDKAPYMYTTSADANNFSVFNANAMGTVSFGLIAPDGTGIGYLGFAGNVGGLSRAQMFLDTGTAFDGIYADNVNELALQEKPGGTWYVSSDSIKGVITSSPVAVEEAPAAFSVAQNSPNPFNPTTTISFSIAEAGNVSIDVFNVAGQKVDTIANEFMSAGSHSVTWDASGFSAGIYFYTVKSGEFAKTMKMTLLK